MRDPTLHGTAKVVGSRRANSTPTYTTTAGVPLRFLSKLPTLAVLLAALLGALALAGCSSDAPALLASGLTTGTTPDKPAFNPFSNTSETSSPAREVMLNPAQDEIMKAGALPEFSIGRADAPVTIIKYMSLTCQYCRRFQAETFPVLKRDYIDKGHVRFIIREFPIGKTSGNATVALRCAPMEKYLPLYEKFLAQQSAWVSQEVRPDAIYKIAQQVGMTRAQFDTCLQNQAIIDGLKWVKDRGRSLGIIGTPNFFIGDKLVKKEVGIKEIREMVDPLLAGRVVGR